MGEVEIAGYEPLVNDMKRMGEIYSKSSYFADISERTAAVRAFYLGEGHLQAHGSGRSQETSRLCGECMEEGKEPGVPHRAFMGSGRPQETDRLCGECMEEGKEQDGAWREDAGYSARNRVMEGEFATLLSVYEKGGWEIGISRQKTRISHHVLPRQGIWHRHGYIEIFYVIEGSFEQILLGERRHFTAGEVVITDQNCEHADYIQKEDAAVLFLWLQPEFMDQLLESCAGRDELQRFLFRALERQKSEQSFLELRAERETETARILEQLVAEDYARLPGSAEIIRGNLMRLFHLLCTSYALQLYSLDQESREKVLLYELERYIRLHAKEVTAGTLGKSFHYHRNYYNLLLKKYKGKSFRQYVTDIRIAQAKELLEQTALPVKEIAGRVGYENTTFFYRLFERETGMAPAEWRARDDGGRSVPADRADKRKQEMPGQEEG